MRRELEYHNIPSRVAYRETKISYGRNSLSLNEDVGYFLYIDKKNKKIAKGIIYSWLDRQKISQKSIDMLCHGCFADQTFTIVRKKRKISEYLSFGSKFYQCTKCGREWEIRSARR